MSNFRSQRGATSARRGADEEVITVADRYGRLDVVVPLAQAPADVATTVARLLGHEVARTADDAVMFSALLRYDGPESVARDMNALLAEHAHTAHDDLTMVRGRLSDAPVTAHLDGVHIAGPVISVVVRLAGARADVDVAAQMTATRLLFLASRIFPGVDVRNDAIVHHRSRRVVDGDQRLANLDIRNGDSFTILPGVESDAVYTGDAASDEDTVAVTVVNGAGSRSKSVDLPSGRTTGELLGFLASALNLPKVDTHGDEITYRVLHSQTGRQMYEEQTLAEAGVQTGDTLRVVQELCCPPCL